MKGGAREKMKLMKPFVFCGLCLLLLLQMVGCDVLNGFLSDSEDTTQATDDVTVSDTESETSSKGESVMKTYQIAEHLDSIKVIGRSSEVDAGITCDWSASGISFALDCGGDVSLKLQADRVVFFTVIVDGVRTSERIQAGPGTSTVTLAKDLADGLHRFSFLKQTENANGLCVLNSISFSGSFCQKPSDQSLYIEFYGDSITCGYGNLVKRGESPSDPGSALWQDGTQTYAFRTAEALNADWSMISVSGIPFSKGYTQFTMGEIMEKTNFRRSDEAYSFARKPDLAVINLGTNDQQCGADMEDVKLKAKAMIETLKSRYGADQKILFVTGMMNETCRAQLLEVISDCGGEANFIYETAVFESNRYGGNGHPDMTAHIDVAEELVRFIRVKILGG